VNLLTKALVNFVELYKANFSHVKAILEHHLPIYLSTCVGPFLAKNRMAGKKSDADWGLGKDLEAFANTGTLSCTEAIANFPTV